MTQLISKDEELFYIGCLNSNSRCSSCNKDLYKDKDKIFIYESCKRNGYIKLYKTLFICKECFVYNKLTK